MIYRCWLKDDHDEEDGVDIEATAVHSAAARACDRWNEKGKWSGDPLPDEIEVYVRDLKGDLYLVDVGVDFSVHFSGGKPRLVEEK
jgi:hypothetical protein